MVFSAVAAYDFVTTAFIFVVSLAAAPRTRRSYFTASFHCMSVSKTCLAAQWSFKISAHFSFFFWFLFKMFFLRLGGCTLSLFTAILFNIRDVIVVDVDQALGLVDFVSREYFNFDPSLELWRAC